MIRLGISVEGYTEEAFVRNVLADHLRQNGVEPYPIVIGRARSGGRGGGNVSVRRLVNDIVKLHYSYDAVTSLVDFYGFRDREESTVELLEERLGDEIAPKLKNRRWVMPYVQKYEFEGLLFSKAEAFHVIGKTANPNIERLLAIRQKFSTPEDINDDTAPGKRIEEAVSGYRKRLHGPMIARETGLPKIRAECPRFNAWATCLEGLAGQI
ncbi:MAG: DUF4276 family protein [Roseovarius sp.]|nr:DUF4276 family protein [Roseovarius sp.]MCY4291913.1 DUF4276 family protein [Roseovarius sp.]MCY4315358.1 DUF4276 family protein [Roseovarius sp.]